MTRRSFRRPLPTPLRAALLISISALSALAADAYSPQPGPHKVLTRLEEWTDAARDRKIPVKIYMPDAATAGDAPLPVIITSHGLGGTREGIAYAGNYWTGRGYVCVHLQHPGSDASVWRDAKEPLAALKAAANAEQLVARARDVSFAIDHLTEMNKTDPELRGRLDMDHVGVSGHSFGAQTVLALIGESYGVRGAALADPRIKAAVAFSPAPPSNRAALDHAFDEVKVPVFHLTGTEDHSPIRDVPPQDRRLPFDHMNASDQYLVILTGARHMTFGGVRTPRRPTTGAGAADDETFHRLTDEATAAFWDAYLKDDAAAREWLRGEGWRRELGKHGTFECKSSSQHPTTAPK
jgi:predicted dienelactone hydrolase